MLFEGFSRDFSCLTLTLVLTPGSLFLLFSTETILFPYSWAVNASLFFEPS